MEGSTVKSAVLLEESRVRDFFLRLPLLLVLLPGKWDDILSFLCLLERCDLCPEAETGWIKEAVATIIEVVEAAVAAAATVATIVEIMEFVVYSGVRR